MNEKETLMIQTLLGALLHDVGKVVQRAEIGYKGNHSEVGREFLKKIWADNDDPDSNDSGNNKQSLSVLKQIILDSVSRHHLDDLNDTVNSVNSAHRDYPVSDSHTFITYIADKISAGADRIKSLSSADDLAGWDKDSPLQTVFSRFGETESKAFYDPEQLGDREPINFPVESPRSFNKNVYTEIVAELTNVLSAIRPERQYVEQLLAVLETTLSFVPSAPGDNAAADISLYDHLRLTGAFASAIWVYLDALGTTDFRKELVENEQTFLAEETFLLYSFDLSGVQDFIYTIHSTGAAKLLRSRSFYLEIVTEHLIDELLETFSLTRANLNYAGGGHAYLILPNVPGVDEQLQSFEDKVNEWFLQNFKTSLYLASSWTPFSANIVMVKQGESKTKSSDRAARYSSLYRSISEQISSKKLHRYSADQLFWLNSQNTSGGRECEVCRRSDSSVREGQWFEGTRFLCSIDAALSRLSSQIQQVESDRLSGVAARDLIAVYKDADHKIASHVSSLPLPLGKKLVFETAADATSKKTDSVVRTYSKNKIVVANKYAARLWLADFNAQREFSAYSAAGSGLNRLAALRLDVDDLGKGFTQGFTSQQSGVFNTISRTASFSRLLSLFFRQHINYVLENPRYRPISGENLGNRRRQVSVIYSGGDDVFVVGAWVDVFEFSLEIQQIFTRFSQNKITLSGGIGMFADKFPISVIAQQTGKLESSAKSFPGKNALTVFTPELTFSWDELRDGVVHDKFVLIANYLDSRYEADEERRGTHFIYQLLSLLRTRKKDTEKGLGGSISLARWVYYLSRLEPRGSDRKDAYRKFTQKLYEWFQRDQDAKQLELALYLYIYRYREDKKLNTNHNLDERS